MAVLLSLGSNLGDRAAHLRAALDGLRGLDETAVGAVSGCFETAPWGDTEQASFLNLAVEIETALGPLVLLNAVKKLEAELGREPGPRWGPRVIDIDLILWDDLVLDTPELTLPHKEFRSRAFVLQPLAEIAADAVDPVSALTVAELAQRSGDKSRVERVNEI